MKYPHHKLEQELLADLHHMNGYKQEMLAVMISEIIDQFFPVFSDKSSSDQILLIGHIRDLQISTIETKVNRLRFLARVLNQDPRTLSTLSDLDNEAVKPYLFAASKTVDDLLKEMARRLILEERAKAKKAKTELFKTSEKPSESGDGQKALGNNLNNKGE